MLFLLMQITIASRPEEKTIGLSNPWTEYVKMLPKSIPVPTLWTEEERLMLVGTSLEVRILFVLLMISRIQRYRPIYNASTGIHETSASNFQIPSSFFYLA